VLLLAAAIAGCATRVPNDELVVLVEAPALSPDPRFAISAQDFKLGRLLYAPLVAADEGNGLPTMVLAERVTPLDDKRWEVIVRDGAKFSDGRPVEAEDVAWTVRSMLDPATKSRMRQVLNEAGLVGVSIEGPRRLVFTLKGPRAPFVTDLNFGIIARPRPGESEAPRGVLPVGAGPFVFESRDGETWHLGQNPHFVFGAPKVRRVTIKTIRDDNSRLLALVGGSGDLTQNTISPLLVDSVAENRALRVETGRSSVWSYIGFNCEDEILSDVRVRKAIAHAIDRERIVRTKLRGRGVVATSMLPTFHWAYEPDVESHPYDPARAKALLDEAGWRDPDGDGPEVRFTIVYKTSNNRFRVAIASVIAEMLREVGIGVDLRVAEFATFFADIKKGNFQMFSMQITEIVEPDLHTNFFASSRIPRRDNLDAGGNRMRYRSAEVDRLLDEGRAALDRATRKKIYAELQRVLARDLPALPLWHEDNVAAMRKEVRGYVVLPTAQLASLATTYKE
jgi:peptide/nickel transport system substrate-binding protein